MSEGALPVAIAQGVDAAHVGAQLIIHLDIAALIHGDACVFQPQVVRVRNAANREQHMGAEDGLIAADAIKIYRHLLTALFQRDAFSVESDVDAFVLEDLLDGFGDVFVFTPNEPWPHLYNRDLTAKAAVHLSKFQTHVAAADDNQMLGQKVYFHHSCVVQVADLIEAGQRWIGGASPDIDEELTCLE